MDNEIYQLVKHLSQRGLDNLTSEEKLIKLWQRAGLRRHFGQNPYSSETDSLKQIVLNLQSAPAASF